LSYESLNGRQVSPERYEQGDGPTTVGHLEPFAAMDAPKVDAEVLT